jgi:hypothetical protein
MMTSLFSLFVSIGLIAAASSTPAEPQPLNPRKTDQPVSEPTESQESVPDGYVALFNDINLDGWEVRQVDNRDWHVVDGVIDCDPHEGPGDRNLWTKRSFGDFELLVDWRITQGPYTNRAAKVILADGTYQHDVTGRDVLIEVPNVDSGVFLRGEHKSQVNIWCWPVGSGEVWGYRTDPSLPPEIRAAVTPSASADRPIGQWNTFHITLQGDRLTVRLNGQQILDRAQLPGIPQEGPIALQHHGDRKDGEWGASFVQFRNIYIRELPTHDECRQTKTMVADARYLGNAISWVGSRAGFWRPCRPHMSSITSPAA